MEIPFEFGSQLPQTLRKILWSRGLRSEEEISNFLYPSLSQMPDPSLLLDFQEAIALLVKARENKTLVVIFGDYDVDGTTSTALLVSLLREWGFNVDYYIPHRVREGYGVTERAAQNLIQKFPKVGLVVTCDSGISSFDGIGFLKEKKVSVIVTDHHEVPPARVSADAILNPKQSQCQFPYKKLAGVGVAFVLAAGLRRALNLREFPLTPYLDLVALGTVCDVAEMSGLNRIFTKIGLQRMATTERVGLRAILKHLKLENKKIRTQDLGFLIGPRLNAGGRVGEPDLGARTLLAESVEIAEPLIKSLEEQNTRRKAMQAEQVKAAEIQADELILKNPICRALILSDSSFHLGIVGLIASKISERYQRPTCVLTELNDEHELANFGKVESLWKGSLRAPIGYHLQKALEGIRVSQPELLKSGGGHAQAAGVAIQYDSLAAFEKEFEAQISLQGADEGGLAFDCDLEDFHGLDQLSDWLEPYGPGNRPPLFRFRAYQVKKIQIMKEAHLKLWGQFKGQNASVLHFRCPWVRMWSGLSSERERVDLDFLGELTESEWNGVKKIEFLMKDVLELRVSGRKYEINKAKTDERSNEVGQSESLR